MLLLQGTLLTLGSCLKDARSRLFARGCGPGSVMFVEIDSSWRHMLCPVQPYAHSAAAASQQTASL